MLFKRPVYIYCFSINLKRNNDSVNKSASCICTVKPRQKRRPLSGWPGSPVHQVTEVWNRPNMSCKSYCGDKKWWRRSPGFIYSAWHPSRRLHAGLSCASERMQTLVSIQIGASSRPSHASGFRLSLVRVQRVCFPSRIAWYFQQPAKKIGSEIGIFVF